MKNQNTDNKERQVSSKTTSSSSSNLTSSDVSSLRNTWGVDPVNRPYSVSSTESSHPVVSRIGRGYNVFGNYASVESIKQPILDVNKLISDQKLERVRYEDVKSASLESRSINDYSRRISEIALRDNSVYGFGSYIDRNFDRDTGRGAENFYSTFSHTVRKYGVYIKPSTRLEDYLTADAKSMISDPSISPSEVFETFGHYALVDSVTGGRIDYNITVDSSIILTFDNFRTATRADLNSSLFNASTEETYLNVRNKSEYLTNRVAKLNSYGGTNIDLKQLSNPQTLTNWGDSLDSASNFVEFGEKSVRALVPIWEFCTDPIRANSLKTEFERLNISQSSQWPQPQYVTDIFFATDRDKEVAKSMCPSGYQLLDTNLNPDPETGYTFMCYKLSNDSRNAYTNLFLSTTDRPENRLSRAVTHNTHFASYSRLPLDLSMETGENHIYLWGTKDSNLSPITSITIAQNSLDSNRANWDSILWQNTSEPANIFRSASSNPVFIQFKR